MDKAIVIKSKGDKVKVECPYCYEIHSHSRVGNGDIRVSHCHNGSYVIERR